MRRPTRCPRCGNTMTMTQGPLIKFACGTTYKLDSGTFAPVSQCNAKADLPGPEADPVHGERPKRPLLAPLAALLALYGPSAQVGALVAR